VEQLQTAAEADPSASDEAKEINPPA